MQTVTLARNAMATRFELVLHGENISALRAAGEEALEEIARLENQLSLYRPGSEIAQLNARAANEAVRVTPELFALLHRAFGYLDANDPTARAVSHFETELARIAGVHDEKKLKADPAFALGNLFGRLPLSRTPLLKTLATEAKSRNSSK